MTFSILRLLIMTAILAVCLGGARLFVAIDQAREFAMPLVFSWAIGFAGSALAIVFAGLILFGAWCAAGDIEKFLRRLSTPTSPERSEE